MSLERTITVLPRTERLGILLGLVVLGLGISPYVPLPSPVLSIPILGASAVISVTLTPARQVGLVVTLLACAAVDGLVRAHRRLAGAGLARTFPFWVLPAGLTLGAFESFQDLAGARQEVLGLVIVAVLLTLVVTAQLHTLAPEDPWFGAARLVLNALAYALALGSFVLAHTLRARALLATPLVALASTLLALELLRSAQVSERRLWGIAAVVGLMMAEVAWAVNRGVYVPPLAGFLLLLAFYGTTGVLQQHLWGHFSRRTAIEFLIVAAVALTLVFRLSQ